MARFFFYGTLGDPAILRDIVGNTRTRIIGPAEVNGTLYDAGAYPALKLSGNDAVSGSIVDIDDNAIPQLDEYEGVAEQLFRRRSVNVTDPEGAYHRVWVYEYQQPTKPLQKIQTWPST